MTPQEQEMLKALTERVNQTKLQEKDPDAENLLGRELGANADALYILAQTVLVQDIALQQAKAQVTQLQQQLQETKQQPAHATSFLGGLFGHRQAEQPRQVAAPPAAIQQGGGWQPVPQSQQAPPQYQPPQQYQPAPSQYYPPQSQPQYVAAPGGQPSFLRGAMQTAAGVAAGALAFEGVESILHGFGGHSYGPGWGGGGFGMRPGMGFGGAGFERPVEETVVNNYYDQPGPGGEEHRFEGGGNEPHFHESADQGGAQFSDASYNTSGNDDYRAADQGNVDQGNYDSGMDDASAAYDNSVDDVQIDDGSGGGGFDDGGSFDSGGGDGF